MLVMHEFGIRDFTLLYLRLWYPQYVIIPDIEVSDRYAVKHKTQVDGPPRCTDRPKPQPSAIYEDPLE